MRNERSKVRRGKQEVREDRSTRRMRNEIKKIKRLMVNGFAPLLGRGGKGRGLYYNKVISKL